MIPVVTYTEAMDAKDKEILYLKGELINLAKLNGSDFRKQLEMRDREIERLTAVGWDWRDQAELVAEERGVEISELRSASIQQEKTERLNRTICNQANRLGAAIAVLKKITFATDHELIDEIREVLANAEVQP